MTKMPLIENQIKISLEVIISSKAKNKTIAIHIYIM